MKHLMIIILRFLLILLLSVLLELNHNTLVGWLLFVLWTGLYLYFRSVKQGNAFLWLIGYLVGFAIIVFISWPPVRNVPAVTHRNPKHTDVISLPDGDIRGVFSEDETVEVYTGIPFAKPPVGELRWQEPRDPDPWEGVLDADHFRPMSMQTTDLPLIASLTRIIGFHEYKISLDDNYRPPVSEDSLYLNVWKPAGDKKDLPVLVYIHGGSLQTGQPWYADYNGEETARQDVVFVTLAYRLGVFGFFADEELIAESEHHTTGNYGLLDMIKGLEWIQKNIVYFGGDPDNVTVAGESAGSAAVSALCTAKPAAGLFRRVVLESSTVASIEPPHSYRSFSEALASGKRLKEKYQAKSIADLRKMKAEDLVDELATQHHMTVDGYVLEQDPYLSYMEGKHNEEAIIHGYNSEESEAFLLFDKTTMANYEDRIRRYFGEYAGDVLQIYPAQTDKEAAEYWSEIYGAVFFSYPHYCLNRLAVRNGIPVYEYFFSKHNGRLGPWHSGEEIYLYHNIPKDSRLFDEKDRKLSDLMWTYLLDFVRNGTLTDQNGSPHWPVNEDSKTLLEFGDQVGIITERSLKLYAIMDKMQGWKD